MSKVYPDSGIKIFNEGTIVFRGPCKIGNNSSIVVGNGSTVDFGANFMATTTFKALCFKRIEFKERVIFGWDCTVMDTDFHPLFDLEGNRLGKGFGPISIGKNNWFSQGCLVTHSTSTPEGAIFAARSVVTRGGKYRSQALHAGAPAHVVRDGVKLDYSQYMITDYDA